MNKRLAQLVLITTLGFLANDFLQAQIVAVTDATSTPIPGGHSYIQMLNETVNPANGSVSLRLQVPAPPARGLTIPFGFAYDSTGAHFPGGSIAGVAGWNTNSSYLSSGGWAYSLPMLSFIFGEQTMGKYTCPYYTGYVFQDNQATRYSLGILTTPTTPGCTNESKTTSTAGPYQTDRYGETLVDGPDGTIYTFSPNTGCGPIAGPGGTGELPSSIEDRNGNKATFAGPPYKCDGSFTMTDTLGRVALNSSGFGKSGDTLTVAGLASPYTVTWGSASSNFSVQYKEIDTDMLCRGISSEQGTQAVITSIELPDGTSYQFQYTDNVSGLLSKIIYPNGGYISYAWGPTPSLSQFGQYGTFPDSQNELSCEIQYAPYVLQHRYVSFDGSTIALQQDFAYATQWNTGSTSWSQKTTTVTTHDEKAGTSFNTVYDYAPYPAALPPLVNYLYGTQIPLEQSITYDGPAGTPLEQVIEKWDDIYHLASKQTTLYGTGSQPNVTSLINYSYTPFAQRTQLQEEDDYDFGNTTTPLKKKIWTYQAFPATPVYPDFPSIVDRPCKLVVENGASTSYAETDYLYDGQTTTCGTAAKPSTTIASTPTGTHDETNYGPSVTTARGNATSVTLKCLQGCSAATTKYSFDETGQVLSMTDPCGNVTCADIPGTNHTTTYSYADSPSGGNPEGNSNAYLTQITDPNTGVAHIENYQYNYASGELTQSKDQNNIITNYSYNDPLDRLTLRDSAPGALNWFKSISAESKTSYSYPSGTEADVAQDLTATGDGLLKSSTLYDGMWHATKTVGRDGSVVETAYNGLNQVCAVSNPTFNDPGPLSCVVGQNKTTTVTDGYTYFTYDPLGRKTLQTQPDSTTQRWVYNANLVDFYDETNSHWQRFSDALSRLTTVFENDPAGSGALTLKTAYTYNPLDNLLSVNQQGASGDTARYRTFAYDSLSRLTNACNPEALAGVATCTLTSGPWSATYTYDANSNVSTRTDARGIATNYIYDALNRITGRSYTNDPANTPALSYGYDQEYAFQQTQNEDNPVGHLNWINATVGTTNVAAWASGDYDQRGNLTGYLTCLGSNVQGCPTATGAAANIEYDLNDSITGLTGTSGGASSEVAFGYTYNRDSSDRLYSLTTYIQLDFSGTLLTSNAFSGLTFYPGGAVKTANLGIEPTSQIPAVALSRTYDNRGRITGEIDTNSLQQSAYSYSVSYDGNNNVTGYNDSVTGTWTVTNDALHRLSSMSGTVGGVATTAQEIYDNFGNRKVEYVSYGGSQSQPLPYLTFSAGNNRIDYGVYDNAGNLLYDLTNNYLYDAENRLCAVQQTSPGGDTIGYVYGANGDRLGKGNLTSFTCDLTKNGLLTANGVALTTGYDRGLQGEQLEVTDGNFNMQQYNILWEGKLLGTFAGTTYDQSNWHFALNDWVGTKRVTTKSDGTKWTSIFSGPFGDYQSQTGPGTDPSAQHFTSKERDIQSNLDYFTARDYNSNGGRFMSPDSGADQTLGVPVPFAELENPQSLNLYSYVRNNPLSLTDPDGQNILVCVDGAGSCLNYTDQGYQNLLAAQNGQQGINLPTGSMPSGNITCGGQNCGTATFFEPGLQDESGGMLMGIAGGMAADFVIGKAFGAVGSMLGRTGGEAVSGAAQGGTKVLLSSGTKQAAKDVIEGLADGAQKASAKRAVAAATRSESVSISQSADGTLSVTRTRPGFDGSQTFTKTIDSAGNSSTVQTAHDAAGNLVHYDPKN